MNELNVQEAVRDRYSQAAQQREAQLCCPVDYDQNYLKVIPDEVIERDYGCGDPSRHVKKGETVLDLGSGTGKICFIASQVVGSTGRVIGVDCNEDMLSVARKYQNEVGDRIGYHNVEFRKGQIQDLQLDLERLGEYLAEHPAASSSDWLRVAEHAAELRRQHPLIASESIDVVVSNCVLNLVHNESRQQLFSEVYRVLRHGGRAVISDIVSDEDVPLEMQNDAKLWSGCISGAFREDRFLQVFEAAGFYGVRILSRQNEPWAVVNGIEFRSMTVEAFRGLEGPCLEQNQAIVYKGPWKSVEDDLGHRFVRGERTAVCGKAYHLLSQSPYAEQTIPIAPAELIPLSEAAEFDCSQPFVRPAADTKHRSAEASSATLDVLPEGDCCGPDCC